MIRNILKGLIIISVLISGVFSLAAYDFFNITEEGEINGFPMVKGRTENGIDVTVIQVTPEVNPELEYRIADLLGSFDVIPVKSLRITLKADNEAEIFITNKPFSWKEYNMADYLLSGFTILMDGAVDYDADLFVNKLHIRLEGFFESEGTFLDTMTNVIADPGTFLMSRDPEYILNTFMSMMTADEEIRNEIVVQKETSGESNEMIAELQGSLVQLSEENQALKAEIAELKYNNLIMENRSLFGGIRMIDRTAVDWIIAEKTKNPSISATELGVGLTADTGLTMGGKQIILILALYFGEYPE
ncbi:MAG: hypothetical protein JEY99_11660 [Spirochaetales bacterium]|nr:hypothetical protein [Spirochaetales bacterium]